MRRLEDEVHVPLAFASLEVIHLETIRQPAEGEGKYIRQTGGHGNYAHVKLRLQPDEPGKGIDFVDEIKRGVIPPHFIQSIEAGIREAAQGGILAGHELVNFKAMAYDGSFHEIDSNDVAFRIAGSLAFKEAAKRAAPSFLNPVSKPSSRCLNHGGSRSSTLSVRGAGKSVCWNTTTDGSLKICAIAPLETMLGFDAPVPDETSFIGYREKPRADNGSDEAGSLVTRPRGPRPRSGFAAVDPDVDWT